MLHTNLCEGIGGAQPYFGAAKAPPKYANVHLAGVMTPSNTHTTLPAPGLTLHWRQRAGQVERVMGRTMTFGERQVIQYNVYQDHFRRGGTNVLIREPGTAPTIFEPRLETRTLTTQGYGVRVRATGDDVARADDAVTAGAAPDILDLKADLAMDRLNLEADVAGVAFLTATASYATNHSGAVGNAWDTASGDFVGDIRAAKQQVTTTCGALDPMQGEWVLVSGMNCETALVQNADIVTRWNTYNVGDRSLVPDRGAIAQAGGLNRYEVIDRTTGPAAQTGSIPTVTSNALAWPSTNKVAALLWIDNSVSVSGVATPGKMNACTMLTQYGPWDNRYFGGDEAAGPEGQVEWKAMMDDWAFIATAIDSAALGNIVAGYLFTGVLT